MNGLRIALPGGTLLEGACALLDSAGVVRLDPSRFDRELSITEAGASYVKVRPTDVPVYVEMGACDCGIVGKDVLWESSRECYELADLRFGMCRLVLAAPRDSPLARAHGRPRCAWRPSIRRRPAASSRRDAAELIRLHGSVELAPATGLADCIVDIVATGRP